MGLGLVNGPATSALDLLGQVLPGLGHGVVGQEDQVEVLERGSGAESHMLKALRSAAVGSIAMTCTASQQRKGRGE
ncbi:hypothetical protein QFZ33_004128 [Arthrobacter globiformis]|nr:hypothetical protein [Arthrobacter globiformis]